MAVRAKKSKKTNRKVSVKKEVEIPVFVISKNEREISPKEEKYSFAPKQSVDEGLKIVKDEDDLPVFRNSADSDSRPSVKNEDKEEEIKKTWGNLKHQAHSRNFTVAVPEKKNQKKAHLSENKRRAIMWTSVAVLAGVIFFIWLSSLKNNFSEIFGSVSYTFSRSGEIMGEVENGINELESQTPAVEETPEGGAVINSEDPVLDEIKERILLEELKNKLGR
ncbi:hypothetical protein HZB93_03745 [Candidatus Falkowbacteria bacterium]|nr:hypothetical protein [Candidatus Falkowbacteria bacterium]